MQSNLTYKPETLEEVIGGRVVMMATPTSNHNRAARNISSPFDHLGDLKK